MPLAWTASLGNGTGRIQPECSAAGFVALTCTQAGPYLLGGYCRRSALPVGFIRADAGGDVSGGTIKER